MIDREAVIKELENYEPYARVFSNITVTGSVILDALALLKEQEQVKPVITPWAENEDGEVVIAKRECGRCGYQFFTEKPNYCENCGAPILWEEKED